MSPPEVMGSAHSVDGLAAETERAEKCEPSLVERLTRYSLARRRAVEMLHYTTEQGHTKEARKLARCGSYLTFRSYYTVNKIRLHAAEFCKQHLLCPLCAIRRGSKALKAYLEKFQILLAEDPSSVPYMVTFTVKNGPDLVERFNHLKRALQRLHKYRGRGRLVSEVEKANAAVWSYEFTNKGAGWHPHVHAIWLCSSPPNAELLSAQWRELTGDSFIVDVRPIVGDPVKGFLEVLKYAVKFSQLELSQNWHAYRSLFGERLIASFGRFRGVEIPENLLDDDLNFDDLPYVELMFRYYDGRGYVPS